MASKKKPKSNYQPEAGTVTLQDVFQTPPYALDPLLPYLEGKQRIWESAAGQGYLSCWLTQAGKIVTETDLSMGYDRFTTHMEGIDAEITNVPFSQKYRWTKLACEQGTPFALLMPADILFAGSEMWPLFDEYDLRILLPDKRIDYKPPTVSWEDSSAQMHTCWVTRGLGVPDFVTRCYLNKPSKPQLRILAPIWDKAHAEFTPDRAMIEAAGRLTQSSMILEWKKQPTEAEPTEAEPTEAE